MTLCIRYTLDPNKLADFKAYGLIDIQTLASYEQYRRALAEDPDHKRNAATLEQSGAIVAMNRSIVERVETR